MTSLKLHHVVIKVDDLETAIKDFEKLEFTVTYEGEPESAQNALIFFHDGKFIELAYMRGKFKILLFKFMHKTGITKLFGTMIDRIAGYLFVSGEERICLDRYGDTYRKYLDRTPRYI